ncbi:MAG TPA: DUF1365 domain-containing protein [Turneriella sp.]|nr:DUF1365 domain-containing protein [Turneriella sp.]
MTEGIYEVLISHTRPGPVRQSFKVRGYMLCVDVARFDDQQHLRLLGFGRRRLHNFRRGDFSLIARDGVLATSQVLDYLKAEAGVVADAAYLLANPAIAGYVFNPVSFFFCTRRGEHVATILEVNNTFGEQKHFVLPGSETRARAHKNFYVSPFISPFADFAMKVLLPAEKLDITINTMRAESPELLARMSGTRFALSDMQLLKFSLKYPFYTIKVIVLIHYYALRLFIKGVPFFPKKNTDAAIMHTELRSSR